MPNHICRHIGSIKSQVTFDGGMFMVTYMTGVVESWMYWPLIAGAVFLFKYKKKKALFEQEHPGQVSMAWPLSRKVQNCCVFLIAAMLIRSIICSCAVVANTCIPSCTVVCGHLIRCYIANLECLKKFRCHLSQAAELQPEYVLVVCS